MAEVATPKKKMGMLGKILIGAVILVVIGGVAYYFFVYNTDEAKAKRAAEAKAKADAAALANPPVK